MAGAPPAGLDWIHAAAQSLDRARHLPFLIAGETVGWLRRDHVTRLDAWPALFAVRDGAVEFTPTLATEPARTAALDPVVAALARAGHITGWRNERYAISTAFDAPPLAYLERAAARFFGTRTYAVHVNGIVTEGGTPRLWIARRARTKPVDPGLLDNLVGGGLIAGADVMAELVREAHEEAGIPAALARAAVARGAIDILRDVPEGVQQETLFAYDLELPADFAPRNEDGEVTEMRLMALDEVRAVIAKRAMTLDASLVTAGWLARMA